MLFKYWELFVDIQSVKNTFATMPQTIGNTPLVELKHTGLKPEVKILCKLEGNNPAGSVKDRPAFNMIASALEKGILHTGGKIIEATSGNTGIALAMAGALLGVKVELVMPANASAERVLTMRAYGAKVTLTPAEKSMEGAIDYAREQAKLHGYIILDQFANPDNYLAHYKTTGPEIWRDTQGQVTHFVSAMGTTGTIMGTSMFLKEKNPTIQIVGVHPASGSNIPGIRKWPQEYLPAIFNPSRVDEILEVSDVQATMRTRMLAKFEGILAGMSSGGAVEAALQLGARLESGLIVCIICDRGDRYLSTTLFNQEE
jgi:S-sulfo-L-cysteine synthase (O-acetyl-L-serine-dependent)